jgi:hypothetical protein
MDAVALVCKLVLAAVFGLAAAGKVAEQAAFRRTLPLYGVPGRLIGAAAIGVPLAELVVAVTLVPTRLAPWGAVSALVLLAVFTGAAALARARGVEAECECFGPLDPLGAGARPFVRNIGLGSIAALAVATEMATGADGSDSIVVGAALVAAVLAAGLAISARKLRERRTRAGTVGTAAPATKLRSLTGERIPLASPSGQTLLLFWNPSCPPCQYMLPRLKAWESDRPPGSPRLIIASSGSEEANRAAGLASPIVLEGSDEARRTLAIPGKPAAVLLDGNGRVMSEPLLGAPAILAALGAPP